jgi:N-methylhydantoinase A
VTDANLVLGRLPDDRPLGASFLLDQALAHEAIRRHVADPLGLSVAAAAFGIVRLVNARMAYAVREVTVERGRDVRSCALVAFGGAGPQHACALADLLGVRTVLIPPLAGAFSAFGMLQAPIRQDMARTIVARLGEMTSIMLQALLDELAAECRAALAAEGIAAGAQVALSLDLRYTGQEYTLRVPVPADVPAQELAVRLHADFVRLHRAVYGHAAEDEEVELVAVRAQGEGPAPLVATVRPSTWEADSRAAGASVSASLGDRTLWVDEVGNPRQARCPWYIRERLEVGQRMSGPAVVLEAGATLVLQPGWSAEVSAHGALVLRREAT